jgi:hypothetical protein
MNTEYPSITIKVGAGQKFVPVDDFLSAVKELKDVAVAIEKHESGISSTSGWEIVELQMGSAVVAISPVTRDADLTQRVRSAIGLVESGAEERPSEFSDSALRSLKKVAQMAERGVNITVSDNLASVLLTARSATAIDNWLGGRHSAYGSIEGKLDQVSIHKRLRFTIYDREDHEIRCNFDEGMMPQVKQALGERVAVRGHILYRTDGIPASIEPEEMLILKSSHSLPPIEDMLGVWQLDVPAEEYVRRLHDD